MGKLMYSVKFLEKMAMIFGLSMAFLDQEALSWSDGLITVQVTEFLLKNTLLFGQIALKWGPG